jgi:hypothetical protein
MSGDREVVKTVLKGGVDVAVGVISPSEKCWTGEEFAERQSQGIVSLLLDDASPLSGFPGLASLVL